MERRLHHHRLTVGTTGPEYLEGVAGNTGVVQGQAHPGTSRAEEGAPYTPTVMAALGWTTPWERQAETLDLIFSPWASTSASPPPQPHLPNPVRMKDPTSMMAVCKVSV